MKAALRYADAQTDYEFDRLHRLVLEWARNYAAALPRRRRRIVHKRPDTASKG